MRWPTRRNVDEDLRDLERRAAAGDGQAAARLLSARVRSGSLPARNVRLAALMGVPEAKGALGLEDLEPARARDDLVLLLDTSDRAYAVLWGWANALAAIRVDGDRYPTEMVVTRRYDALIRVRYWVDERTSEAALACRDDAFSLADTAEPPELLDAAAAYAALSVAPRLEDFPERGVDDYGNSFVNPGDFPLILGAPPLLPAGEFLRRDILVMHPDLFFGVGARVVARSWGNTLSGVVTSAPRIESWRAEAIPMVSVRWSPSEGMPEGGEGDWPADNLTPADYTGGALAPLLAPLLTPRAPLSARSLFGAMRQASRDVPAAVVRPDVAVAANANLAAVFTLVRYDATEIQPALTTLGGIVAGLVRPWLLGPELRGAFRHGRELLSGSGWVTP